MSALSEAKIRKLAPPERGSVKIRDGGQRGLYLVVTANGVKTFTLRWTRHGRQHQRRLGQHPELSLTGARRRAQELLGAIESGQAVTSAMTVSEAFTDYWKTRQTRLARPEIDIRLWQNHVEPGIGHMPMSEVRRRDVLDLWDAWRAKSIQGRSANRVLSHFLGWATDREIIPANPMPKGQPTPPQEREHTPTLDDMRKLWRWTLDHQHGPLFRWIILTGGRRREVSEIVVSELDLTGMIWTCPAARMKARRVQRWPIIPAMIDALPSGLDRIRARGRTTHLFPNKARTGPTTAELLVTIKASKAGMTVHDIRRGLASCWAQHLGISDDVIGLQLAHKPRTITSKYQRSDRLEQLSTAEQEPANGRRKTMPLDAMRCVTVGVG